MVTSVFFLLLLVGILVAQFGFAAHRRSTALNASIPPVPQVTHGEARMVMRCHHCGNPGMSRQEGKINTSGMSLFDLDWANKSAMVLICDTCGYVHWFLPR